LKKLFSLIKRDKIIDFFIEIVIIIVGVLLAFYVTKLGDSQKQDQTEKEIIKQVYFELKENLVDLEQDLAVLKVAYLSNLRVLSFLESDKKISDSLVMDFHWMTQDEYIFPNTSGYENLKSFGLNLIKNDSLRNLITLVYNNDFPRITVGNNFNPNINQFLLPYYQENFALNKNSALKYELKLNDSTAITYPRKISNDLYLKIGYKPLNVDALKKDEAFLILANKTIEMRMHKLNYYSISIKRVKDILKMIKVDYSIK
jgi:hypothetical protein